jgi:hypothetical protein
MLNEEMLSLLQTVSQWKKEKRLHDMNQGTG